MSGKGDPPAAAGGSDPYEVARLIVLQRLSAAPRSRSELAQTLARRGIPDTAVTAVLDRMQDVGLVDDVRYAEAWVQSRHAGRKLGRRALAAELRRKGIDDDVARRALAQVDAEGEFAAATDLVRRKLRSMGSLSPEAKMRRLAGLLARRGYGAELSRQVIRDALADTGAGESIAAGH
ncbi:MAG: recombination regulator RecX [Micrococcales bacterium]|nr:MAG: recombination regulator RecX [Micrococcales bacterium]PIE27923.1 MAG: recombination regulator RecX [Micrococcales bacterium]